jgi:hypothetical protein
MGGNLISWKSKKQTVVAMIREKILSGIIKTSSGSSNDQLADIFTKPLPGPRIDYIWNKPDAYDIYAQA